MKKIICGILAAAMAISCCACSGGKDYSVYGDSAVLEAENVKAKAGKTVDVEIYLNNNPGTAAVGVELHYDTSILTAISAEATGELKGQGMFYSNVSGEDELGLFENNEGEYVDALWANAFNFTGNGEVMTITFQVAEDAAAGEYPITFTENEDDLVAVIENENDPDDVEYKNLDVVYLEGSVTVS